MATGLFGLRGTGSGSLAADERPKNWRQKILQLFPNGDAPLTALLSRMREQPTDDPQFNWFEKGLPVQAGQVIAAGTSDSPADDANVASGGADGTDIFIRVAPDGTAPTASDHSIFKVGHLLMVEESDEVLLVVNKTTTSLRCRRDIGAKFATNPAVNGSTTTPESRVVIIGTGFPEGSVLGEAIAYAPLKHYNFTQIFRTPLFLTRTARRTRLRYDQEGPLREARREALQLHALEMERGFLFGERSEQTSGSGASAPVDAASSSLPLRTTRGLLNWLPAASTSATASVHWDIGTYNSGILTEDIVDQWLAEVFRYGSTEKLAFCGSTFLNVVNQMAKNKMTLNAVPADRTYGMRLMELLTPFGTLLLKQHPLMSHSAVWRKDCFVVDVDKLTYRYIDDTTYVKNRQNPGDDATKDEYLTECGLEVHFSGATSDSGGGLAALAGPGAHGRLKGVTAYGG